MNNLKLSIHHVGGRAGTRSFPILKKFEKDFINVLYDADEDCVDQIQIINQKNDSELHVMPYALSDKCKNAILNINYDPYTSSLLEGNKDFDSFYQFDNNHDYILGEATKAMEKRKINVLSLDHVYEKNKASFSKPDFLSLDVEGGEYDILKGSSKLMKSSILSVCSEVVFFEFRKQQKMFGDLSNFLSKNGFYFVAFTGFDKKIWFEELSPYRYPVGLRGSGFHATAEALFLRKIDYVKNIFQDPSSCYINLRKLAFISIVFNQIEYGLECIKQSQELEDRNDIRSKITDIPNYLIFTDKIKDEIIKYQKSFPKTFTSLYSFKKSKVRFRANREQSKLRKFVKKFPGVHIIYSFYLASKVFLYKKWYKLIFFLSISTNFEKTFKNFGLINQYKSIKKKRILQRPHIDN